MRVYNPVWRPIFYDWYNFMSFYFLVSFGGHPIRVIMLDARQDRIEKSTVNIRMKTDQPEWPHK
jgi:hypothetical protein